MDAGKLTKRIKIQYRSITQSETGEPVASWADLATVWANIFDVSGSEFIASAGTQNAIKTKIIIRKMSGILPAMRVVHGSVIYNIEAPLVRSDSILLMCSTGAANG